MEWDSWGPKGSKMEWLPYCYYNPDRQLAIKLNGPFDPPKYAIGDIVTPRPVSMHDSPLWVKNSFPKGHLGYLPHGYRIVSPFGIKYVYR